MTSNRDYKNKGSFSISSGKEKPEVKDRITGSSETERRQLNQGTTTQRPQPRVTPTIPKRLHHSVKYVLPPNATKSQINTTPSRRSTEQLATPPRSVQTTPAKEKTTSPTVNRSTTDKPRTESRPAEPTRSSSNQPNRNTGRR